MPKPMSTITASVRVTPGPRPTPSMTLANPTTVTVKVAARPSAIPTGGGAPRRARAQQRGQHGQHAGLSAVPAPARSAKTTRKAMPGQSRSRRNVASLDAKRGLRSRWP